LSKTQSFKQLQPTLRNAPDENRTRDLWLERTRVARMGSGVAAVMRLECDPELDADQASRDDSHAIRPPVRLFAGGENHRVE